MPDKNPKTKNKQQKLKAYTESVPGDNRNQNHDARQVPLGPNTKRRDGK